MKKLVIRFNAPVVLLFALLSLLVLLLDGWTGGVSTTRFFCVYRSSLADPLTYVRFFGHVLGHSGYSHYMNICCCYCWWGRAWRKSTAAATC